MLFLSAATDKSVGFPLSDTLLVSLVGFAIVFFVLVVLILAIKLITALSSKLEPAAPALAGPAPAASAPIANPNAGKVPAIGSLGECNLHNVDDKTAALLMAIVADNMQAPLNELRFQSIKEIGEGKKS